MSGDFDLDVVVCGSPAPEVAACEPVDVSSGEEAVSRLEVNRFLRTDCPSGSKRSRGQLCLTVADSTVILPRPCKRWC